MSPRQPPHTSAVPRVLDRVDEFADVAARVDAAPGDPAADASAIIYADVERASSYRYDERAFLIQLHVAEGIGPWLVDPEAGGGDIGELAGALSRHPVCLHACRADLPSLLELGMVPSALHDTEIAAKVLSTEGFSLGHLVESYLGVHMAKEYSRADWSRRPLPAAWLEYALEDVVFMPELLTMLLEDTETVPIDVPDYYPESLAGESRAQLYAELMEQMVQWRPNPPGKDRWRRLSKLSTLRSPREYARARELWSVREEIAAREDIAPHRIVRDASIVEAAHRDPRSFDKLAAIRGFADSEVKGVIPRFVAAIKEADALGTKQLPPRKVPHTDTPDRPSHRFWKTKAPGANALLGAARERLAEVSDIARIEMQTLLSSAMLREWVWAAAGTNAATTRGVDPREVISTSLSAAGASPWQIRFVTPALLGALDDEGIGGE
ncbi:HRDC domain-containing protein [Dietzia sp.]|uniref:HRDC domain-containing protein n=1 Tax=Dietzia sp. TaxID=1871616 RepID=UPI002FD900CB